MKSFASPKHLFCLAVLGVLVSLVSQPASSVAAPKPDEISASIDKSIAFLKTKQNPDGSFAPKFGGPGITALITAGLVRHGRADDPMVKKALEYLEKNVQPDGGIYNKGLANYATCVALIAFKEANTGGKYDKVIANASKFLQTLQSQDKDDRFGGVGYDGKGRPDLSNSHFFVEALIAAGVPKDDPAIKNALIFLTRCQNLPGEIQKQDWATKAADDDKGGFVYNPFAGNDKKKNDRVTAAGGLRSEGGMTYSGLKSFLYAGVSKEDARVKAALGWIRKHYTLDENPGMKDAGLFYYYHTFAKAMDALGEESFEDAQGKKHDWRQELFDTLKKQQAADGSWVNKNGAFLENSPELASAYAILALSYCTKK
ncbi:MAG: terpene cyclase/mutase family protein [Planctomycetes bacterium]|nr:terpene cyclase/mutase family protein [Planctomycetota bacterium]